MDENYAAVAGRYGFTCGPCPDNCCRTRFFHHTVLEYLYLRTGFEALDAASRRDARQRARQVLEQTAMIEAGGGQVRLWCPLNVDERCIVYPHRPMICRLHGIPHELRPPGRETRRGPGCADFERRCGQTPYIVFDRTDCYAKMARLEQEIRERLDFRAKLRMTVAEMIVSFTSDPAEPAQGA
jgi:Fe-S-cluster containining protein